MPIEITCTGCERRLRVPDKVAGKRIKCPKCETVLHVPEASGEEASAGAEDVVEQEPAAKKPEPIAEKPEPKPAPEPSLPDRWYMKTEEGADYGPVPRAELDEWVQEGRVTSDCQILQDGAEQWQWASDVFPELEEPEAETPPPSAAPPVKPPNSIERGAAEPSTFDFAAADASPTLRAKGRRRVRKVVKKSAPAPAPEVPTDESVPEGEQSNKSKIVAGLLGIFLGAFGVHRFYLGYTKMGLIMLFTFGGLVIWSLIDAIMVLVGKVPDVHGRPLKG